MAASCDQYLQTDGVHVGAPSKPVSSLLKVLGTKLTLSDLFSVYGRSKWDTVSSILERLFERVAQLTSHLQLRHICWSWDYQNL